VQLDDWLRQEEVVTGHIRQEHMTLKESTWWVLNGGSAPQLQRDALLSS
jgi:hypothetical protein